MTASVVLSVPDVTVFRMSRPDAAAPKGARWNRTELAKGELLVLEVPGE